MQVRYKRSLLGAALLALSAAAAASPTYYVDNAGNDDNDGLSEQTPWKSVWRVSRDALTPGARVLFKRGGLWRDATLKARGGAIGNRIVYGAYGTGDKPRLLGSVSLTDANDWVQTSQGSSIWVSQVAHTSAEQIAGCDFSSLAGWTTYAINGATVTLDTSEYLAAANANTSSVKVQFSAGAVNTSDIQLRSPAVNVTYGGCYHLSFWAKASAPVTMASDVRLANAGDYTAGLHNFRPSFGTDWAKYDIYLRGTKTASDGQVRLYLGQMASSGTLNIDAMSLRACDINKFIEAEVGNVIFDSAQGMVGTQVLTEAELNQDGKFWYDAANKQLRLYLSENPATVYGQLEVAHRPNIAEIKSVNNVEMRDLDLRYGAGHGVQTVSVKNVVFDGLDISYVGGSRLSGGARYGNGIELFESAQDVVVQNSQFSQIFDVAMTSQGGSTNTVANIRFQNNLVLQSEQCFELWNRYKPDTTPSSTTGVVFTRNTCIGSGTGWSHAHHKEPDSADVLLYSGNATLSNVAITDNIFYGSITTVVRLTLPWNNYMQIDFGGNCYLPAPNVSTSMGLYLKRTEKLSDDTFAPHLFVKDKPAFVAAFGTNTATSQAIDPQLTQYYVPAASSSCVGKGYLPPAEI